MINIEAVKILIHTNTGNFGRIINFKKGLNIIRANNTSGKSSLFGAILYGLGFEEILGSRNEKALQSVFKSIVKELGSLSEELENTVIQSEIYLQFSNGQQSITTRRFVVNDKIKPQAVEVFLGPIITSPEIDVERLSMYVHDAGAAMKEDIGFHKFLEDFIGAKLPEIINQEGKRVKMFLPLIATAHFIEQKAGWSDFYNNMPYYGIRDAAAKVFEYILGFEVFEAAAKRQEVQNILREINNDWTEILGKITALAKRGGGEVVGVPISPEILDENTKPYLRFLRGDKRSLLPELISSLNDELKEVIDQLHVPINKNIPKIEDELNALKQNTDRYELLYDNLSAEVSQDRERLRQYTAQSKNVDEDLRKNKDAAKLQTLGLDANLSIGRGICPTCNQVINDTLLHEHLQVVPMRIDENITYLQAQHKMIDAFINNLRSQIIEKETRLIALENAIQTNRQRIRALKRTLISDDRLPSEEIIERKVVLERELNFLYRLREEFEQLIFEIYNKGKEYGNIKASSSKSYSSYLSKNDQEKLEQFQLYFKQLLINFGFTSKPVQTIKISLEKYLPVYELTLGNGVNKEVDIRYESSASDYIRAQWAYYTALMRTSTLSAGNHFQTIVFDEPQQQSASIENFNAFLLELEKYKQEQVIVLASFQNSEEDFRGATLNLTSTNIIDLTILSELLVKRISNNESSN